MAASAFETYRKVLFQQQGIPLTVRGQLFTILVDATFFNLEIWEADNSKAWRQLEIDHTKLMRRIFAKEIPQAQLVKMPLYQMCQRTGHPPLDVMLKSRRLRYLITLVTAAPKILWALIKYQKTWAMEVVTDMEWLRRYDSTWPEACEATWPQWWHAIKQGPGRFRRAIKKAATAATADFIHAGICGPCKQTFAKKANLACHLFKVHGRRASHRYFVGDGRCTHYHDVDRLHAHLVQKADCWHYVKARGLLGQEPIAGIGSHAWKKRRASQPILCPPVPGVPGIQCDDVQAGSYNTPAGRLVQRVFRA